MITTLLWDVDGTLLNFLAAEEAAIKGLFQEYHLGICSDEMLQRYSQINKTYWERLENGEISKSEVLIGRFRDFFREEGLDTSLAENLMKTTRSSGRYHCLQDDSLDIVRSLKGKVKQYVVSNGTVLAQTQKLKLSGLGDLMEGIFLSETLGAEKPSPAFFQKVFSALGDVDKSRTLIIGDSLTSDIRGGNNAGILTCWYNPGHFSADSRYTIDYEIADLHELYHILSPFCCK